MIKKLLLFILSAAVIAAVILFAGGRITDFLDVPSVLVVVSIPVILLFYNFSAKEIGNTVRFCFNYSNKKKKFNIDLGLLILTSFRNNVYITALMGSVLGVIFILITLNDKSALGKDLAVAMLTILYALIINLIIVSPAIDALRRERERNK